MKNVTCVTIQQTIFIVLHPSSAHPSNIQNSNAIFDENEMKYQLMFMHQKDTFYYGTVHLYA